MSRESASDKSGGKWASELFAVFNLYERFANRLLGLIILEAAWTILLLYLARFLADSKLIEADFFPFLEVFAFGSAAVLIWWIISTQLWLVLVLIAGRMIKAVALIAFRILYNLFVTIEIIMVSYHLRHLRKEVESGRNGKTPGEQSRQTAEEEALDLLYKAREDPNAPLLLKLSLGPSKLGQYFFASEIKTKSRGSIGLAPIWSLTYEEDLNANKAPMQSFTAAISKMRLSLCHTQSFKQVSFQVLPSILRVRDAGTAGFLRWLLGFDAILWGSYVSSSPPRMHLQISCSPKLPKESVSKSTDSWDWERDWNARQLFGCSNTSPSAGMVVLQGMFLEEYIATTVAFLLTLDARVSHNSDSCRFYSDRLAMSGLVEKKTVVFELIRSCLFQIPVIRPGTSDTCNSDQRASVAAEFSSAPTAQDVLIDIANCWVAERLNDDLDDREVRYVELIARRCVDLRADRAWYYYRLAAVQLYMGQEELARETLECGLQRDEEIQYLPRFMLQAQASMEICTLPDRPRQKHLVHCAIYTFLALTAGNAKDIESARRSLAEELVQKRYFLLRKCSRSTLPAASRILFEVLGIADPAELDGPV